ncbi:MAG: NADPH-Fe(3+) oxidoreductase subunit beta [Pseudomonadales bacterium]|nr:NADPH-Fe(3+) oxidoreductase subunit beta [Pseudomonadales bacterium]
MKQLTRGAWGEPGSSLACHTGSWRDLRPGHEHAAAPCHAACPAGEDPQYWLAAVQEGDHRRAWERLVAANPLPAITGRVCPHPCEQRCNRGHYDTAIGIHGIERFLGDAALAAGWDYPGIVGPPAGAPRVAVVGAGPAGISVAYHLLRHGLVPVVFEAAPEAGGLLRSAIPMTRLPRAVLDAELERVLACGIGLHTRQALGRDFSLDELRAEHAALFLAPGCARSRPWDVQGVIPAGTRDGLDLLKSWIDVGEVPAARRVVVHGGGNTAMDIARVMKRHGAEEVHLVTASGLPGPQTAPDDVLNIVPRELEEGLEEGIVIHPHATLSRVLLRGARIVGVELVALRKLERADGRRARVAFEGTERILQADLVIPCIGEQVDPAGLGALVQRSGFLRVDARGGVAGACDLYAGGDACGNIGTVAAAVGDGRRAANAIAARLAGAEPSERPRTEIGIERLNLNYFEPRPARRAAVLPVAERDDLCEIEGSLDAAAVADEAGRCFACGNCLACDNCWVLCPDAAVLKIADTASDGSRYVFDYDYCKGCGLCASECPSGFIAMRPEPE